MNGEVRGAIPRERITNDEPTATENIILQCIISGILIVFVLLISISNTAPASTLRGALNNALSGAETVGELISEVRFISEEYFGWGPTPETEPDSFLPIDRTGQSVAPTEITLTEITPTAITPTAASEVLNPQIPEPLAVPELWD